MIRITLSTFIHRKKTCLSIIFPYNFELKEYIKKFSGVYWSNSNRCFYIYYSELKRKELIKFLEKGNYTILEKDNDEQNSVERIGKAGTFSEVKNSYTKGSFKNIFPNNKSTRGRINGIIAREVNKNHKEKINWYIIPLEKTNIINIFEDANIDLDKSFKGNFKSFHCDFLEWLMMQTQDKDKSWNRSQSKFGNSFIIENTISF